LAQGETQELTEEELEFLNSVEWITVVEEGQEIDDEALDNWLRQRGYKV
jgi:predicted DNA-binding protein (MmcQ/YjbR family)